MNERLEAEYRAWVKRGHASSPHLPRLRELASLCCTCTEFGTKNGASATALLLGCSGKVTSYDILPTPRALALKEIAGPRWEYKIEDTRTAKVEPTEMLFVDAMHNYHHVRAELEAHADKVSRFLVFHDTITFGSFGAVDESGREQRDVLGIRPAIDELMIRNREWFIREHHYHSHGLLVLERLGR